ncbi:hypothetical protein ACO0RG_003872 [Hanseniaspora osmophila]|uniref:54S ribosomal protein L20, mitochondrial n=1 Tax=Hanseniaspora osmophila TaxID=56408 RepID=A0A1E5RBF3_9ASCO|nr:54S ribosomal protein L20, mitochondrial [Hanseniaspora osmophila]
MFRRYLSTSIKAQGEKKLSKFIHSDEEIGMQVLKGSPTIYNADKSASNYKGYLKAKVPKGFYYHPAQSSNTGSVNSETIPVSFMSSNDPRKTLPHIIKQNAFNKKISELAPPVLPSKSSLAGSKTYHLEPKDVQEIQKLRLSNPDKYTRKTLAKMFNVSPLFISIVSSASKERLKEMDRRLNIIKNGWSEKRTLARDDRIKRKALWTTA